MKLAALSLLALFSVVGCSVETDPRPNGVAEVTADTSPPKPGAQTPAAPATTTTTTTTAAAGPFCAGNTGHGACLDFDSATALDPFRVGSFVEGSNCTISSVQAKSGTKSLLCKEAQMADFFPAPSNKLAFDMLVVPDPTQTGWGRTLFSPVVFNFTRADLSLAAPAIEFQLTYDPTMSPDGQLDFKTTDSDAQTFPTNVAPAGWHHYELSFAVASDGTVTVTAAVDEKQVFGGNFTGQYPDLANAQIDLGGNAWVTDGTWTQRATDVYLDNVVVN